MYIFCKAGWRHFWQKAMFKREEGRGFDLNGQMPLKIGKLNIDGPLSGQWRDLGHSILSLIWSQSPA